ncbi:MAG: hypothetical protein ACO1QR_17530 [Chthoniobacteraceae bacterium]
MNWRHTSLITASILSFSFFGQAEDEFWANDRLTPAQPFPGRVCAVANLWPGYNLLIEEIGGKRLCLVRVWAGHPLEYSVLDPAKGQTRDNPQAVEANGGWTYLSPAVEINRFSWSMGPFRIGKIFGDDDVLRKVAPEKGPEK